MMQTVFGTTVILLLLLACLLQVAVIRDQSIYLTRRGVACRWVIIVALAGLAGRFIYLIKDDGVIEVPWHSLTFIGMLALGIVGIAMEHIERRSTR